MVIFHPCFEPKVENNYFRKVDLKKIRLVGVKARQQRQHAACGKYIWVLWPICWFEMRTPEIRFKAESMGLT